MCVCMYVCLYIYKYVHVYISGHVCMYVCMYVYIAACMCICLESYTVKSCLHLDKKVQVLPQQLPILLCIYTFVSVLYSRITRVTKIPIL